MVIKGSNGDPGRTPGGSEMEKRISPKPPTEAAPEKKAAGVEKTTAKKAKKTKKTKKFKKF
jgi:hypothetical protein